MDGRQGRQLGGNNSPKPKGTNCKKGAQGKGKGKQLSAKRKEIKKRKYTRYSTTTTTAMLTFSISSLFLHLVSLLSLLRPSSLSSHLVGWSGDKLER